MPPIIMWLLISRVSKKGAQCRQPTTRHSGCSGAHHQDGKLGFTAHGSEQQGAEM